MLATEKTYEFEGNTVEEAINSAVKNLNVSRETLKIRILAEPQKGLFGMDGVKPARIKATIKKNKN
jgi:spoIIIJ-associated protein